MGPLPMISAITDSATETAHIGAFPFCACSQVTTTTTSCACTETVTNAICNQKRKGEADEEKDGPTAKRFKTSCFSDVKAAFVLAAVIVVVGVADDAIYEPQPKRRKISYCTKLDVKSYSDSDDEGFAGDDEASTGPEDDKSNNANANLINEDSSPTASEEGRSVVERIDVSTLSFASSSTAQPISSTVVGVPFPTSVSNVSQHAHIAQSQCSITSMDIPQTPTRLQYPRPLPFPPRPRFQSSRRRKSGKIVVHEDDTATPSGWSGRGLTYNEPMPTVSHRVFATVDRGQENRQPVYRRVEARYEWAQFLDEDDGEAEEVGRMASLVVSDTWPSRDWLFG